MKRAIKWPFDPKAGLIVCETKIYGPKGDFVVKLALDTGATSSLINWHVLNWVGYNPAAERDRVEITTGSGVEYVPRLKVHRIETLGKRRRNFPVLCHTLPPSATVDGLLGLDFLRKHRLELNFQKGFIKLD